MRGGEDCTLGPLHRGHCEYEVAGPIVVDSTTRPVVDLIAPALGRPRTPLEQRVDKLDGDFELLAQRINDLEARLARYEGRV
jgi:hypothetical protein